MIHENYELIRIYIDSYAIITKKYTHVRNGYFSDVHSDTDMPFIATKVQILKSTYAHTVILYYEEMWLNTEELGIGQDSCRHDRPDRSLCLYRKDKSYLIF